MKLSKAEFIARVKADKVAEAREMGSGYGDSRTHGTLAEVRNMNIYEIALWVYMLAGEALMLAVAFNIS